MFEQDPYPGKPKILFIGLAHSSHTHSWIGLLDEAEINTRLFAMPSEKEPPSASIKTYISVPYEGQPNDIHKYIHYPNIQGAAHAALPTPEEWLALVVNEWQPHIIHTFGLFDDQGGRFYYYTRKGFGLERIGKWVLQLRGGSDIALRCNHPGFSRAIREVLEECDQIITDNYFNISYIAELGLSKKVAWIAPVPGSGGLATVHGIADLTLPSKRQRSILWPRAYWGLWSNALAVIEAIKLAWEKIKPCTIYITAVSLESELWLLSLPEEIKQNCRISPRIPREQLLTLMRETRVMLAPSLVDGVPNVLYEAMAYGAFPIVSPLDTITPVVSQEKNVLFARNLYPNEIADALVRGMSDDRLVDQAAKNNLDLVKTVAGREAISKKVIRYYSELVTPANK